MARTTTTATTTKPNTSSKTTTKPNTSSKPTTSTNTNAGSRTTTSTNTNTGSRTTTTNNTSSPNNSITVEAEKIAAIEAYETMRKGLSDTNIELTNACIGLISFMESLGNLFSGEKAKDIQNKIRNVLDDINTIGDKVNGYLNNATQKVVELGGNPNTSNNNQYLSKEPLVTPIDASIYSCDIDGAQNALKSLDYISQYLNNAKNNLSTLPQNVAGCEGINNVASQINDTGTNVGGASRDVQDTIDGAKTAEQKNANLLQNIGNGISNLWGNVTDWVEDKINDAKEWVNDTVENTTEWWDNTVDNATQLWKEQEKREQQILDEKIENAEEMWDKASEWWDNTAENVTEWWDDKVEDFKESWNDRWSNDNETNKIGNPFVLEASAAEIDIPSISYQPKTNEEKKVLEALQNGEGISITLFNGENNVNLYLEGITDDGRVIIKVYDRNLEGTRWEERIANGIPIDEFFSNILPYSSYCYGKEEIFINGELKTPELMNENQFYQQLPWEEKEAWIWDWLIERGFSEYLAAGIIGNINMESSYCTKNIEDKYEGKIDDTDNSYTEKIKKGEYTKEEFVSDAVGYGILQWTHKDRKEAFWNFVESSEKGLDGIDDIEVQMQFVLSEVEKLSKNGEFYTSGGAYDAGRAFGKTILGGTEATSGSNWNYRGSLAWQVYDRNTKK